MVQKRMTAAQARKATESVFTLENLIDDVLKEVKRATKRGEHLCRIVQFVSKDGYGISWEILNINVKTGIINELKRLGYSVQDEVSRLVVSW